MQTISANDSNITYIGRWIDKQFSGVDTKVALSGGLKLRFKFTGTSLSLNFRLATDPEQARLAYSIDGGAFNTVTVAASKTLATGLTDTLHTVEIYCDSTYFHFDPASDTWNTGEGLQLQSVVIGDGKALSPWLTGLPKVLIFGDSITEGLNALGSNEAESNIYASGRVAWGNVLGSLIGAETHLIGYGSQGVSKGGRRGVPAALAAYPYKMAGVAQTDPEATAVIVAYGANDGLADSVTFKGQYRALLDAMRANQPTAHFYLFPPFSLATEHQADIAAIAAESAYSGFCTFINVSGWSVSTTEGVHPNTAGHAAIAGYLSAIVNVSSTSTSTTTAAPTTTTTTTTTAAPTTTTAAPGSTAALIIQKFGMLGIFYDDPNGPLQIKLGGQLIRLMIDNNSFCRIKTPLGEMGIK